MNTDFVENSENANSPTMRAHLLKPFEFCARVFASKRVCSYLNLIRRGMLKSIGGGCR